jgi:hypothetical protein
VLVRGLNALAAVVSTPLAAPVIAATRLRGGSANSARGAASLVTEAISAARQAGCSGQLGGRQCLSTSGIDVHRKRSQVTVVTGDGQVQLKPKLGQRRSRS